MASISEVSDVRRLSTASDFATVTLPARVSSSSMRRRRCVLPEPTSPETTTRRPVCTAAHTSRTSVDWCSVSKLPAP